VPSTDRRSVSAATSNRDPGKSGMKARVDGFTALAGGRCGKAVGVRQLAHVYASTPNRAKVGWTAGRFAFAPSPSTWGPAVSKLTHDRGTMKARGSRKKTRMTGLLVVLAPPRPKRTQMHQCFTATQRRGDTVQLRQDCGDSCQSADGQVLAEPTRGEAESEDPRTGISRRWGERWLGCFEKDKRQREMHRQCGAPERERQRRSSAGRRRRVVTRRAGRNGTYASRGGVGSVVDQAAPSSRGCGWARFCSCSARKRCRLVIPCASATCAPTLTLCSGPAEFVEARSAAFRRRSGPQPVTCSRWNLPGASGRPQSISALVVW